MVLNPAPATTQSARSAGSVDRLLHIQGLRGMFCAVIVLGHADGRLFPGAFAALDGFFLASGLVIGLLLFREHEKTQRVEFVTFYLRRGRRLLPNLAVMLLATAVATLALLSPFGGQSAAARTGIFAALQGANFDLYRQPSGYFDVASRHVPLLHTWSLGVEEQVYLVLPATMALSLLLANRLRQPGVRVFAIVVALSSTMSLALFVLWSTELLTFPNGLNVQRAAFYLPIARWWEVGVGMLLACWYISRPALTPRIAAPTAAVGLVGLSSLMIFPIADHAHRTGPLLLVPMGALVLILVGCRGNVTVTSRFLHLKPLVWLGDRSYSWYLWHYPVIVFARAWFGDTPAVSLTAAALSFGVAWLAYETVEKRWRYAPRGQPRRTFVRGTTAIIASCMLVPAAAFAGVVAISREASRWPVVADMADQVMALSPSAALGCSRSKNGFDPEACTVNADGEGPPIYLVGSSTSGMHSPALQVIAEELDSPLIMMDRSGCPFLKLEVSQVYAAEGMAESCLEAVDERHRWLLAQHPGVLVTASDERILSNVDVSFLDPLTGAVARASSDREEMWRNAAARTFDPLAEAGHTLVVLKPLPRLGASNTNAGDWKAARCPLLRMVVDTGSCGVSVSRADSAAATERGSALASWLATRVNGRTIDISDALCPDPVCVTNVGDRWIFLDSRHITTDTSLRMVDELRQPITSALAAAGRVRG